MANWMKGTFGKRPWRALPLLALGTLAAHQSASSFAGAAARDPREKVEAAVLQKATKDRTAALRLFAALTPLAFWTLFFVEVQLRWGVGWQPEFWAGAIVLTAFSGLGLSLSRQMATGFGGDLTAVPGQQPGALFVLTIPGAAADTARSRRASQVSKDEAMKDTA